MPLHAERYAKPILGQETLQKALLLLKVPTTLPLQEAKEQETAVVETLQLWGCL